MHKNSVISFVAILVALLLIVIMAILFASLAMRLHGSAVFFLAGGMLYNPFRTTRKMKVPYHERKRHGERLTESLFLSILKVTLWITILGTILWLMQR